MIGSSIPVKIQNYSKEEADNKDASAGGNSGSRDSENFVSKIDEVAKATVNGIRSDPVENDDRTMYLLDVPQNFQNIIASGRGTFSWELTSQLVGANMLKNISGICRDLRLLNHAKHRKFFYQIKIDSGKLQFVSFPTK